MRTGNGKARLDRALFVYSAHLQVSIWLKRQCPPEGGLYKCVKPVLPVVVISAMIVALVMAVVPAAAMFLLRPASFSLICSLML